MEVTHIQVYIHACIAQWYSTYGTNPWSMIPPNNWPVIRSSFSGNLGKYLYSSNILRTIEVNNSWKREKNDTVNIFKINSIAQYKNFDLKGK